MAKFSRLRFRGFARGSTYAVTYMVDGETFDASCRVRGADDPPGVDVLTLPPAVATKVRADHSTAGKHGKPAFVRG